MANTCCICDHPERERVDKELSVPRSDSRISREFGWNRATIARHRAHSALNQVLDAHKEGAAGEIAALKKLVDDEIRNSKDPKVRIAANAQKARLVELEHRLKSEAADRTWIHKHPVFQECLSLMLEVTGKCDVCKSAMKDAFESAIEGGDTRTE